MYFGNDISKHYPPKISFWTQEDRENYEADLITVLNKNSE
jgi:hypothetical protein